MKKLSVLVLAIAIAVSFLCLKNFAAESEIKLSTTAEVLSAAIKLVCEKETIYKIKINEISRGLEEKAKDTKLPSVILANIFKYQGAIDSQYPSLQENAISLFKKALALNPKLTLCKTADAFDLFQETKDEYNKMPSPSNNSNNAMIDNIINGQSAVRWTISRDPQYMKCGDSGNSEGIIVSCDYFCKGIPLTNNNNLESLTEKLVSRSREDIELSNGEKADINKYLASITAVTLMNNKDNNEIIKTVNIYLDLAVQNNPNVFLCPNSPAFPYFVEMQKPKLEKIDKESPVIVSWRINKEQDSVDIIFDVLNNNPIMVLSGVQKVLVIYSLIGDNIDSSWEKEQASFLEKGHTTEPPVEQETYRYAVKLMTVGAKSIKFYAIVCDWLDNFESFFSQSVPCVEEIKIVSNDPKTSENLGSSDSTGETEGEPGYYDEESGGGATNDGGEDKGSDINTKVPTETQTPKTVEQSPSYPVVKSEPAPSVKPKLYCLSDFMSVRVRPAGWPQFCPYVMMRLEVGRTGLFHWGGGIKIYKKPVGLQGWVSGGGTFFSGHYHEGTGSLSFGFDATYDLLDNFHDLELSLGYVREMLSFLDARVVEKINGAELGVNRVFWGHFLTGVGCKIGKYENLKEEITGTSWGIDLVAGYRF